MERKIDNRDNRKKIQKTELTNALIFIFKICQLC